RGHALSLNMARNDILRAECPLWQKLEAVLRGEAKKRRAKGSTKRVTAADRDYMAQQTADPDYIDNLLEPIFTLSNGRHVNLINLCKSAYAAGTLTVAASGDRTAEWLMRDKSAQVLASLT